ncbi:hypothetical protein Avbf_10688 [Armadillidium vulgare]|nr:hypothetical protein Avbf_10688 [Armadillidium vulgare]
MFVYLESPNLAPRSKAERGIGINPLLPKTLSKRYQNQNSSRVSLFVFQQTSSLDLAWLILGNLLL